MVNKEIKKIYDKQIDIFQKYNQHYYNKDKPIVSDQEFDFLKKKI